MKALKFVLVAALIVVVVGVAFYGMYNLDSLIKEAVEKYGSEAAGVEVSLNEVKVELKKGRIELLGLEVANPPGYTQPYLFSLGNIALQVKPESLSGNPIVIEEIAIDQPTIMVEEKNLSSTNLSDLAADLKKRYPGSGAEETNPNEGTGDEPIIAVTAFKFSRANVSLSSERFGDKSIDMPSFTAHNIGGITGLPPKQLAVALLDEILQQGSEAVKRALEGAVEDELKNRAKELLDKNLSDEDRGRLNTIKSLLER